MDPMTDPATKGARMKTRAPTRPLVTYVVELSRHSQCLPDMMRRDRSKPATAEDAETIRRLSAGELDDIPKRVRVRLTTREAHAPMIDRWTSFNAKVVRHDNWNLEGALTKVAVDEPLWSMQTRRGWSQPAKPFNGILVGGKARDAAMKLKPIMSATASRLGVPLSVMLDLYEHGVVVSADYKPSGYKYTRTNTTWRLTQSGRNWCGEGAPISAETDEQPAPAPSHDTSRKLSRARLADLRARLDGRLSQADLDALDFAVEYLRGA